MIFKYDPMADAWMAGEQSDGVGVFIDNGNWCCNVCVGGQLYMQELGPLSLPFDISEMALTEYRKQKELWQ